MIVSNLIWLHVNSVRMWHYSLCQEEIKLWYLHKIFFFCVVLSLQNICLKDFSRYSSSKHRQEIKTSWRCLFKIELPWMDIFKHKPTKQLFPCSRDSCFLLFFPVSPSNWQITWQNQVRLSKINLLNNYLPKESCFPNILSRLTVELTDFQHLDPPKKGTVWYLYLKLFPLLACMLDSS